MFVQPEDPMASPVRPDLTLHLVVTELRDRDLRVPLEMNEVSALYGERVPEVKPCPGQALNPA
jgi:hypothetical protein